MARSYVASEIIALPKMTASEAVVLATALQTSFESRKETLGQDATLMTPTQVRAMARLVTARTTLEQSLTPSDADTQAAKQADSALDEAWGAFHDWMRGWNRLSLLSAAEQERLQALYRSLFGDGLRFLNFSYRSQWQASKARLDVLADELNRQLLSTLGGLPFGTQLLEAHRIYGEALGITKDSSASVTPEVREQFNTLQAALRDYVLKVQAAVEPDDAASQAHAQALLQPLLSW